MLFAGATRPRGWLGGDRHAGFGQILLTETAVRRLSAHAPISAEEAEAVRALPVTARGAATGAELVAEDGCARPSFLVSGWACRARSLPDGRRQITGFVLPGDALAPLLRPEREPSPCAVVALTSVQMADAAPLRALLERAAPRHRGLRDACTAAERAEERLLLDRIVALGRQTAYERLCGLFLELYERLAAVGLAADGAFPMPLRQETLADALGLSTVHLNRTLQQVRRDGVAEVRGGWVTLLRPAAARAHRALWPSQDGGPQDVSSAGGAEGLTAPAAR